MLLQVRGPLWHFHLSFPASSYVQGAQEQRKAKMARYTPASAPYEELQAARAQRLEVAPGALPCSLLLCCCSGRGRTQHQPQSCAPRLCCGLVLSGFHVRIAAVLCGPQREGATILPSCLGL